MANSSICDHKWKKSFDVVSDTKRHQQRINSNFTFWICWASSRVGDNISAWVSLVCCQRKDILIIHFITITEHVVVKVIFFNYIHIGSNFFIQANIFWGQAGLNKNNLISAHFCESTLSWFRKPIFSQVFEKWKNARCWAKLESMLFPTPGKLKSQEDNYFKSLTCAQVTGNKPGYQ